MLNKDKICPGRYLGCVSLADGVNGYNSQRNLYSDYSAKIWLQLIKYMQFQKKIFFNEIPKVTMLNYVQLMWPSWLTDEVNGYITLKGIHIATIPQKFGIDQVHFILVYFEKKKDFSMKNNTKQSSVDVAIMVAIGGRGHRI